MVGRACLVRLAGITAKVGVMIEFAAALSDEDGMWLAGFEVTTSSRAVKRRGGVRRVDW